MQSSLFLCVHKGCGRLESKRVRGGLNQATSTKLSMTAVSKRKANTFQFKKYTGEGLNQGSTKRTICMLQKKNTCQLK